MNIIAYFNRARFRTIMVIVGDFEKFVGVKKRQAKHWLKNYQAEVKPLPTVETWYVDKEDLCK